MDYIKNLLVNKILKTKDKTYFNTLDLNPQQLLLLEKYLTMITSGYPVDYVLNEVTFCNKVFKVQEGVFIPRWETEWWVGEIIKAKKLKASIFDKSINQELNLVNKVVEIGCGSGIIGLSVCPYFREVLACDLNPKAVDLTQKNKLSLGIKNYQVFLSNLFENKDLKTKIKNPWILLANLPYVPLIDYDNRAENKILFEPTEAIFSGDDGLELYRKVLFEIKELPPKIAFFELDPRNIKTAKILAKEIFKTTTIYKDPDNLDRLLVCQI